MADDPNPPQPPEPPALPPDQPPRPTLAYSGMLVNERTKAKMAKRQAIIARRESVYKLRVAGAHFSAIAQQLGISTFTAFNDWKHTMESAAAYRIKKVSEYRELIFTRHERLLMAVWPGAMTGDPDSLEQAVAILKEQAKLTGAYMPVKVASTTPDGSKWAPISLAIEKLSTEELLLLKRINEIKLLPAVDADVIDGETAEVQLVGR